MKAKSTIKTCAVIGNYVNHSLSPVMHTTAFHSLHLDNEYEFTMTNVLPAELARYMRKVRKEPIYMLAVTNPHKETIIKHLDKLTTLAQKIGAINTVINKNGILTGYNTDCPGAMKALKKHTTLKGKIVAVLGSGGAAKSILYGLYREKARLVICSRNVKEAKKLALKYKGVTFPWEGTGSMADADVIINTTSLGRNGEIIPYIIENLKIKKKTHNLANVVVFDVNYADKGTPLIKGAKKLGLKVIDGLDFLLQQGILQFELYTGRKAPERAMYKVLQGYRNLYL